MRLSDHVLSRLLALAFAIVGVAAVAVLVAAPDPERNTIFVHSSASPIELAQMRGVGVTSSIAPREAALERAADDVEAHLDADATKADRTARRPVVRRSVPFGIWDRLGRCESGGNWQANTGNGYYGGLQFLPSTWRSVGGTGLPHEHSREEQIYRAQILQARAGWGQWPACARKLGLR